MNAPYPAPVSPWKKLIVRALAWGVGCGLGISLVLLSVYLYMQRAHWDTRALRVKSVKVLGYGTLGEHLEVKTTGVGFTIDLENTTGADITLPQSVTVMESTKETGALGGCVLTLEKDYFIPAYHVASISLSNSDLCAAEVQPQTCFDRYFKDDSEIVIFDNAGKYEIRVPIPASITPFKAR